MYDAVRNGPQWSNTLFIITFDEHGGTYDHVPPPWGALNPDGLNGVENGFKFDLFGVRVPTILVSPFVVSVHGIPRAKRRTSRTTSTRSITPHSSRLC